MGCPLGNPQGSRSGIWLKSTILMEKPECACPENDMDCVICNPALPSPFSVQIPPKKMSSKEPQRVAEPNWVSLGSSSTSSSTLLIANVPAGGRHLLLRHILDARQSHLAQIPTILTFSSPLEVCWLHQFPPSPHLGRLYKRQLPGFFSWRWDVLPCIYFKIHSVHCTHLVGHL